MKVEYDTYQKPRIVEIAEQIYERKEERRDLQFRLQTEEFHYRYITKRLVSSAIDIRIRLAVLIPLTLIIILCIIAFFAVVAEMGVINQDAMNPSQEMAGAKIGAGLILLVVLPIIIFGGRIAIRMWKEQFSQQREFFNFKDLKGKENAKKTYRTDYRESGQTIQGYKDRLSQIELELEMLNKQRIEEEQNILLNKKNVQEREAEESNSKFKIKGDSIGNAIASELIESYEKEIEYYHSYIRDLQAQKERLERKIVEIDDSFTELKQRVMIVGGLFFVLLIAVVLTSGMHQVNTILGVIFSLGISFWLLYAMKKYQEPVVLYLVEKDSKLIQTYAFQNDLFPVSCERQIVIDAIENSKREIKQLEELRDGVERIQSA